NWSLSTYLKPAEVRAAFGNNKDMQLDKPVSVGANQPYPAHGFGLSIFFGTIALVIVAIIAAVRASEAKRYSDTGPIPKTGAVTPASSTSAADLPPACRDFRALLDAVAACGTIDSAAREMIGVDWAATEQRLRNASDAAARDAANEQCATDMRSARILA